MGQMKKTREIQSENRDAVMECLAQLRARINKPEREQGLVPSFDALLKAFTQLSDRAGLPSADAAWAAAMAALASPNLSEARKEQLLAILQGREEERKAIAEGE